MDENESIFQWIITLHLRKCHCFHIFQETVMQDQHSIQYRHLTTAMSQNSHDRLTHKKQHVSPIGEVEKKKRSDVRFMFFACKEYREKLCSIMAVFEFSMEAIVHGRTLTGCLQLPWQLHRHRFTSIDAERFQGIKMQNFA